MNQCNAYTMHNFKCALYIYIKSRLQKYCKCIEISYTQFPSNIKFNSIQAHKKSSIFNIYFSFN